MPPTSSNTAVKTKKPEGGGVDNRAAETDPIATAARGLVKGRKGKKPKSKHKGELEEVGRKGILIQPPRPPPPTQPYRKEQLEEVGRKGILVQPNQLPKPAVKGREIEEQQCDKGASLDSRTAPSVGGDGDQGDERSKQKQLLPSGMRLNLLLGFGIILGLIGATLLVALGILYVKPFIKVRDMKLTTCTAASTILTDELVTCTCASDGSQSCLSRYPCLKLWVNFTTLSGEEITNVTLYDSYETFTLQHEVLKVSDICFKRFFLKKNFLVHYIATCIYYRYACTSISQKIIIRCTFLIALLNYNRLM